MTRGEEFQELRPLLFAIAYRILGSVAEAEDAVQETWLCYESAPAQPTSVKAFLSAVVTRVSIDVLRSARVRRETYVGPWLPEPLLTDPYEDPARSAELADSLSTAALLLLERLSPLERAVFVLRDVFGFGFPEIASAVGRSEAACRQLAVRARRHMDDGRPRFEADRREREELAARFFDAVRDGDVDGLRELLAADVQMVGDGGGKAPAFAKGVIGADNVARVLASIFPVLAKIDARVEPRGERPASRDPSRSGRQGGQHVDARRARRTDPDDPLGDQPRQARTLGSGGGRVGSCTRGESGSPPQRLTLRTHRLLVDLLHDRCLARAMLAYAKRWPDRTWAVEGYQSIGRHIAARLLADGEQVVDVPPKLSARASAGPRGSPGPTPRWEADAKAGVPKRSPSSCFAREHPRKHPSTCQASTPPSLWRPSTRC
jgi:RNA polymerase sigma-70 factor (ECF subfamily)